MNKFSFQTDYKLRKIEVTNEWLSKNGFNMSTKSKIIYPLKYGSVPVVFAKLSINDNFERMKVIVYDSNSLSELYAPFYDREFGKNDIVDIIEKNITKELKKLNISINKKKGR